MRSSVLRDGTFARPGSVRSASAYPGGCAIGPGPIDFHLRGLEGPGRPIEERLGYIDGKRPRRLRGPEIHLDLPSVGATENVMMAAAVLAEGTTVIRNAAREPEIVEVQAFHQKYRRRMRGCRARTSSGSTGTMSQAGRRSNTP